MKIKRVVLLLVLLQFVWLSSCIDEYWPEVSKYENLLVLDGGVTNEPGPYIVKISNSSTLGIADFIPYEGCVLAIVCSNGEKEVLTEIAPGIHSTSVDGIQGQIDKSYKLLISTPEDKEYESTFELLKDIVEIEDVFAEVENHENGNVYLPEIGYQFYVNTQETTLDTNFYLWKLESTYHYQSDYFIHWYYTDRLFQFNPIDSLFNCWKTSKINTFYTFNTSSINSNQLKKYPLNYVNTQTKRLTIRYSLLVNQHTISKQAWKYWSTLEEQKSEQGTLYSNQPYQIKGNLININDIEEQVLGYFMVSSVHSKRIFVDRINEQFYYSFCTFNDGWIEAMSGLYWGGPFEDPQWVTLVDDQRGVAHAGCVDCREKGGSTNKPDFW